MALGKQEFQDVVLHLPASLRDRAEQMASRECVSLNLFVLTAVAEKLQRLQVQESTEETAPAEMHYQIAPADHPVVH
jgi:hypothetical protein